MGDDANQVGRILKNQGNDAADALRRYVPKPRKVERARDIFDSLVPYTMEFETHANERTVVLNLMFYPPPPSNCCSNNLCSACETFADGSQVIQLDRPYIQDSVLVYIRGIRRTTFTQTNPATGVVTINSSIAVGDVVRVCYVYSLEA